MRWETRKPGARRRAKHQWHNWFAWHPVRIPKTGKTVIWLEVVKRKGEVVPSWADGCWRFEYKEVGDES